MSNVEWRVERNRPGCYIFLLDHSFSMDEPCGGSTRQKSELLADTINRYISELITQCEKGGDKPRHYYDVAVIGYTTDDQGNAIVESALGGPLGNANPVATDIVSIVELSDNPLRLKDDDGASVPVWVEPVARGGTPMIAGLTYCRELASWWASNHPLCVPPIVIHITDGEESNDGNPEQVARSLQAVATQRGNTLLFNVHLSRSAAEGQVFPNDEASLPNDEAKMLFRMSSELPDFCLTMARTFGFSVGQGARGMAFNMDGTALSSLLSVGTVPQGLR